MSHIIKVCADCGVQYVALYHNTKGLCDPCLKTRCEKKLKALARHREEESYEPMTIREVRQAEAREQQ